MVSALTSIAAKRWDWWEKAAAEKQLMVGRFCAPTIQPGGEIIFHLQQDPAEDFAEMDQAELRHFGDKLR